MRLVAGPNMGVIVDVIGIGENLFVVVFLTASTSSVGAMSYNLALLSSLQAAPKLNRPV